MGQEDVAALLNHMSPDDRTLLFGELPANVTKHLLSLLTPEERAEAVTLLGYEPGNDRPSDDAALHRRARRLDGPAGAWTTSARTARTAKRSNVIYVVDEDGRAHRRHPHARVPRRAAHKQRVGSDGSPVRGAQGHRLPRKSAVEVFRREDRTALPVTDTAGHPDRHRHGGRCAGRRRARRRRATCSASAARRRSTSRTCRSALGRMVKKRAGWLVVLFLGEMLTATAMGFFEKEIARAVVLALFVPLIISSGGNSGSQASTLVIRAMAVGELRLSDWWRVIRREVVSGVALGVHPRVRSGSCGSRSGRRSPTIYGPHWVLVASTVGAGAGRRRALGHARRLDAAAHPAPARASIRRPRRRRSWPRSST